MMHLWLLFFIFGLFGEVCYFVPPAGWDMAQPKSAYLKIGFMDPNGGAFPPRLNLATEEVHVSLNEYVKAVKEQHTESGPQIHWRDLGKISMRAGTGRLTEMSDDTHEELKILQAILVKKNTAYILTASLLKEDFPKFQKEILASFRSLDVVSDLLAPLADSEKKQELTLLFQSLSETTEKERDLKRLHEQIFSMPELGIYWQFLTLQEGIAKMKGGRSN